MSIVSILAGALGMKKKHPAIEQFEGDVAFFRALRGSIAVERDPVNKEELLKNAVVALKDQKYNLIAKMVLAGLVDPKSGWDAIVVERATVMERSLGGDTVARDHGAGVMDRAQTELPILIRNLSGLASKGRVAAEGNQIWGRYQQEAGNVQEALGMWRTVNAEKNEGKKQALRAGIWTRAMNENLSSVVRLEMLEPRNALVAQWKVFAQKLAKGEDVAQDLSCLKTPIERALTAKLAEFARATFGVAVAV